MDKVANTFSRINILSSVAERAVAKKKYFSRLSRKRGSYSQQGQRKRILPTNPFIKFQESISDPWINCRCCKRLVQKRNAGKIVSKEKLSLHVQNEISIFDLFCKSCRTFKSSNEKPFCPFSWELNNLSLSQDIGRFKPLNFMEKQLLRLSHPFYNIIGVNPYRQSFLKGQLVQIATNIDEKVVQLIPLKPTEIPLYVCEMRPKEESQVQLSSLPNSKRFFKINIQNVYDAANYLKENNHLYASTTLRSFQDLNDPVSIANSNDDSKSIEGMESVGYLNLNDDIESLVPIMRKRYLRPLQNIPEKLTLPFSEERCYPYIYVNGINGAQYPNRPLAISPSDYYYSRASSCLPIFENDEGWIFRAAIISQRCILHRSIQWITAKFRMNEKNYSEDDIMKECIQKLSLVLRNIRGSDSYFNDMRKKLEALCESLGPAFLFMTINFKRFSEFNSRLSIPDDCNDETYNFYIDK